MSRRIVALILGPAVVVAVTGCAVGTVGRTPSESVRGAGASAAAGPKAPVRGHWARQTVPADLGPLNLMGVSCAGTGRHCVAVGIACSAQGCASPEPSAIISTANGGETWTKRVVPAGVGDLAAVSCPTAMRCVIAGNRAPFGAHAGAFLITRNGGAGWSVVASPGLFSPAGISCPTAATCVAIGHSPGKTGAIAVTKNGGASWTAKSLPGTVGGLNAISCPSARRCIALGFAANGNALALTTTDGGRAWTRHVMPDGSLTSVSCPAAGTCFAVGVNASGTAGIIAVTRDGGASWEVSPAPHGVGLAGVSCSSALACAVVGSHPVSQLRAIEVTTTGGAAWTTILIRPDPGNMFGVSCTRAGNCTAVGAWRAPGGGGSEGPYIISNQPS